ncbi:MAG: hypothetical protein AAB341_02390 [Planctomycetota bacterium]
MRGPRMLRAMQLLASGMVLLQIGGCTASQILEVIQTGLLGVTAAGAFAIIKNI